MSLHPIPTTMRAWVAKSSGSPSHALSLHTNIPTPILNHKSSDVLIRIHTAALNPADVHLLRMLPSTVPFFRHSPIPGVDFAGTVVQSGIGAPLDFVKGAEVCGALGLSQLFAGQGTLAEYVRLPAGVLALKPTEMSWEEAAGCGVVGQTVNTILKEAGGLIGEGKRVLINGASGGVGTVLVQRVKAEGAIVVGVCSERNVGLVSELGADEVVDYTAHQPLYKYLEKEYAEKPFDVILDCIGVKVLYDHCPKYLKPEGKYLSVGAGSLFQSLWMIFISSWLPVWLGGVPRRYKSIMALATGEQQREVIRWFNEGLVKRLPIDSEHSMDDALKGFERVLSKRAKGKIIIHVKDENESLNE